MKKLTSSQELTRKPTPKKRGLLLGLLAVLGMLLCVAAVILTRPAAVPQSPSATPKPDETIRILDYARDAFESVTVTQRGRAPYTLRAADDGFVLSGNADFPLKKDISSALCAYCTRLTASRLIEADAKSPADYGLADPEFKLEIVFSGDKAKTLLLGNAAAVGGGYYAMLDGDVYLLFDSARNALAQPLEALHTAELPFTFSEAPQIRRLKIEQDGETLSLRYLETDEKSYGISRLRLEEPFRYDAQGERAIDLLTEVAAIRLAGYAGEISALAQTGLDAPAARIEATGADGRKLLFALGAADPQTGLTYAQIDDSGAVYFIESSTLAFLADITPGNLVDPFAHLVALDAVDTVTFKTQSACHVLSTQDWALDGKSMSETDFRTLYQALIGITASGMSEDTALPGEAEIVIRFAFNDGRDALTVEYLPYDVDYYAVRREDVTLLLVKRSALQSLPEVLF